MTMTMTMTMTRQMKPPIVKAIIPRSSNTATQLSFHSRGGGANLFPLRLQCSPSSPSTSDAGAGDAIILHVGGMMCEGCASTVKRILESQPQVSSATVNLASQTATIVPHVSEEEEEVLGVALAQHLTASGFTSTFPPPGELIGHNHVCAQLALHVVEFIDAQSKTSNL
ncbi:hypothetical protein RIF29_41625 [Crotalaria pallida]|uniref:HMA domain-containing protein n=1 Tax=Crotalaria pallida TaxID=3830 RepID=A0AAN9E5Y7_CROPI